MTVPARVEHQIASIKHGVHLSIQEAAHWATEFVKMVEQANMSKMIQKKRYLEVEAWQFFGHIAKVTAVIEWTQPWIENDKKLGYIARARVIEPATGAELSSGEMTCGMDAFPCKGKWGSEKDKAARSAAETWAVSKAYRNKYGFVARIAGFEPVPLEEIVGSTKRGNRSEPEEDVVDVEPEPGTPTNIDETLFGNLMVILSDHSINTAELPLDIDKDEADTLFNVKDKKAMLVKRLHAMNQLRKQGSLA